MKILGNILATVIAVCLIVVATAGTFAIVRAVL